VVREWAGGWNGWEGGIVVRVLLRYVGGGGMSGEGRYGSVGVRNGEVVGVELLLLLFRACSGCGVCGEVGLSWGVRVMGGRGLGR